MVVGFTVVAVGLMSNAWNMDMVGTKHVIDFLPGVYLRPIKGNYI